MTERQLQAAGAAQQNVRHFVSDWVAEQMLFQEAQRRGFTEAENVLRQVEAAKKRLAVNAFLEKELYDDEAISEDSVEGEFERNREAYRLREDVVRMSFAIFEERDVANTFRSKILRGATWDEALSTIELDSTTQPLLLRKTTEQYFTQALLYPEELWKAARALTKEDVSFVIKTGTGYAVVLVHETKKQGEMPELAYARDEIVERLMLARRSQKYNELLSQLQKKYDVDIRIGEQDSAAHSNE